MPFLDENGLNYYTSKLKEYIANSGSDNDVLNLIGNTDDINATETSGTVMGKLNKALKLVKTSLYLGYFEATSSGDYKVNIPAPCKYIMITACSGGGSGGGSGASTSEPGGGGGGGGAAIIGEIYEVTKTGLIDVTIGSGGSPAGYQENGRNGGNTVIGNYVTLLGGQGGKSGSNGGTGGEAGGTGGGKGGNGISMSTANKYAGSGVDGISGSGGAGGTAYRSSSDYASSAGGGGGGCIGDGGRGSDGIYDSPSSIKGVSYGGGGGGGSYTKSGMSCNSGSGASGYLYMCFFGGIDI